MAQPIVMPSMGMYTEEGVLTAWLRPTGARVEMGEPIAEITTEKVTFEIPSSTAGILHHAAEIGTSLRVEQLLGYILAEGEILSSGAAPQAFAAQEREAEKPRAAAAQETRAGGSLQANPAGRASPAAKRLAKQHGIALNEMKGSGPGGRIVEADILSEVSRRETKAGPAPAVTEAEED
ncbi:MAG TPA: E3 binding domain-containing protein [Candidatus Angelobacter sp.]|nr:E3 binding domain-containing protein [Candidatus Angelobacter sp.]